MEIKQFEDQNLAHYSYAVLSEGQVALIDPARDPRPYYEFAKEHNAQITAVIETHPHADFVSSHLEIHKSTGATIYVSKLLGADYPHESFDEGQIIKLGNISLKALNTPGHSPDSISIVALNETGKETAVFTGDTLFIGDCGRPDLREKAGAIMAKREELASQMYHSLKDKLIVLPDDVLVYPAHGSGSLCGKGLSDKNSSTIGNEKVSNWSLQEMSEEAFINELLADQPFIPKYFGFDVSVNKKGADDFQPSVSEVEIGEPVRTREDADSLHAGMMVIDTRPQEVFKKSHLKNSINLPEDNSFETWLGSILAPGERFYMAAASEAELKKLIARAAKIGYEKQIAQAFVLDYGNASMNLLDTEEFRKHLENYTILDIRNPSETKDDKTFSNSLEIPLYELRERAEDVPADKPIVVHCAGGYRSAVGSSILQAKLNADIEVYDLGEAIKTFNNEYAHQV